VRHPEYFFEDDFAVVKALVNQDLQA
jgi:hypothetical protein